VKAIEVLRRDYFQPDEPETAIECALVRERYLALRPQIPIIYLLAVIALCGLQFAIEEKLVLGLNPPSILAGCAIVRLAQWLRRPTDEVTVNSMWRRMRQTTWLTLLVCVLICIWCLYSAQRAPQDIISVLLLGGLTAIGATFGLSSHPAAARIPLIVLALPLAAGALLSTNVQFVAAAISLAVVALLLLRVLEINNEHLEGLITSKDIIAHEQNRTGIALKDASDAATTDFLTELANRRAFMASLTAKLEGARSGCGFALALIDLDRFKLINDSFGHTTGDELLRIVARRLMEAAPDRAHVARLGGDEFAVLLPDINEVAATRLAGDRIVSLLNGPAAFNDSQFTISGCCGLTIVQTAHSETTSSVLAQADIALYHAKRNGSGQLAMFEPQMDAPRKRRAQIGRALQAPATFSGIDLAFQPIVNLRSGRVLAYEALARWTHHELGNIEPADFIPVAEQLNLIGALSGNLLKKAACEAVRWPEPIKLSFNLSAVQLCSASSAQTIITETRRAGLDPERLQVEVTETALLGDFGKARENLHALKAEGVTIVLDDFGAGYSSISYLKEIQFDLIKLDGSLIASSNDTVERQRLLGAVIGLCNGMQVPCVAEHIEEKEQARMLLELGCELGQGYWLQKPMPGAAMRQVTHVGICSK
jgi:diguanylate cyclase (GGDEF)-like protein